MTTAGLDDQRRVADTGDVTTSMPLSANNKYHQYHPRASQNPRGQQHQIITTETSVSFHYQDKNSRLQQQQQQPHLSTTPTTTTKYLLNSTHDIANNTNILKNRDNNTFAIYSDSEQAYFHPNQTARSDQSDKITNDNHEDENDDGGSSEEELMAVASAEEYAAKITKLQQACLIPLKEDLADWLNKILKTSNITIENFMHKLDNGVIICRLAKIISLWCEQQLTTNDTESSTYSTSVSSVNVNLLKNERSGDSNCRQHINPARSKINWSSNANSPLRSANSRSINCLTSSKSATSLSDATFVNHLPGNQFLDNLIKMHQTKIWEDAKCRTFYARDNVCNFIKWSKDFGVNQSVLFESDDLVLHANPRQVVLCLLDVARIAYVKYGFTEAPGLVKFEQEIDKELRAADGNFFKNDLQEFGTPSGIQTRAGEIGDRESDSQSSQIKARKPSDGLPLGVTIDATDKLVMRYCRHKEEEAARKKNELAAAAAALSAESDTKAPSKEQISFVSKDGFDLPTKNPTVQRIGDELSSNIASSKGECMASENQPHPNLHNGIETVDSFMQHDSEPRTLIEASDDFSAIVSSTTCDSKTHATKHLADTGRIDSLDSGEGPTESASTGHSSSRLLADNLASARKSNQGAIHTSIPIPTKRTINYTPSQMSHQTESSINSELSSSRSSLLSNQDGNISNYERQATSDLDGKVMRIAKSYYGKKATKDVTRLSEGKYKIADRIVFVRLLKGHRVMVRIGGGWDTLENFLFRHKSDPSQVIDPDNLLPLETKMPFDKTPQATPTKSASKLPYYRLSNSASSNNLSIANLSISNHSLISSSAQIGSQARGRKDGALLNPEQSSPDRHAKQNLMNMLSSPNKIPESSVQQIDHPASQSNIQKNRILQAISIHNSPSVSHIKRPFYYSKTTAPYTTGKFQRPLASSMAPTASATNIHLSDSSVRSQVARRDRGPNRKLLLK